MSTYCERPLVLIIFGISGNLAHRKLIPALYQLLERGDLPPKMRIVGISRKDYQLEQLLDDIKQYLPEGVDDEAMVRLRASIVIFRHDLSLASEYVALCEELEAVAAELGSDTTHVCR